MNKKVLSLRFHSEFDKSAVTMTHNKATLEFISGRIAR